MALFPMFMLCVRVCVCVGGCFMSVNVCLYVYTCLHYCLVEFLCSMSSMRLDVCVCMCVLQRVSLSGPRPYQLTDHLHISLHVQLPPKPLTLRVFAEKTESGVSKSPLTAATARPAGPKRSAGSRVCRLPQVDMLKDLRITNEYLLICLQVKEPVKLLFLISSFSHRW